MRLTNGVAFGLGKVGMTLAACLARGGHRVIGVDVNPAVVDALNQRTMQTTEQGVLERIADVPRDQLTATTDPAAAISQSDASFVIVPTPSNTLGGFSNQFAAKAWTKSGRVAGAGMLTRSPWSRPYFPVRAKRASFQLEGRSKDRRGPRPPLQPAIALGVK